ncbi:probable serine/threonine-protein kinase PBL21 [Dendrobium catenatum]|uniref:probable serine/threonine-protein kinase PBL21 n=1 Tax=Dendrobium catenatum TaxID=906689 RepID=UPI0009F24B0D|nr:probable serine/threonine-protein kinase PBL21 [Dendrobium catenatum]
MGISQSVVSRRKGITFPPPKGCSRRWRGRQRRGGEASGLENKSWLLAEARGEPSEDEPQSVNSSFRFSFGSQAEAELDAPPAAAATVLLLVSMEDERVAAAERREHDPETLATGDWQRWRRMESLERSIAPVAGGLVRFSYAQIRSATRDFYRGRELGRGALSRVYKGRIGNGLRRPAVAIKRVDGPERESAKAFCRELLIANSLCSPHVVPLLGYCIDKEGLFLVYKYICGGSLDRHLHQNEKRPKVLAWEVRYKVAVGVARAVEYLHFCTDKCVVHRDIKPSNILLSSKKRPMLCDFGLATWTHGPSLPFLCKAVKGTFGYLAPEYFQNGKLSDKTDVYAFGVVLLELITGRKALDQSRPQGDENLVVWAKPLLRQGEDAIEKLVDPNLISYSRREMYRMVQAANACLSCEDSTRPSIDLVLAMLLGEEGTACCEWPLFSGNGCLAGYGSQFHETHEKRDMGGHLALAMLGISDNEEDDSYGR